MTIIGNIFLFIVATVILFWAGGYLVKSLIWLGRYWRISEYLLSLILISAATSLDELFVAVSLALKGAAEASLGTLIGANVINVTLILGEAILLADYGRRKFQKAGVLSETSENESEGEDLGGSHTISKGDVLIIFGMVFLPVLLILDGALTRLDGVLLLIFFGGYVAYLISEEHHAFTAHPYHEFFPGIYKIERTLPAGRPEDAEKIPRSHGYGSPHHEGGGANVLPKHELRPMNLARKLFAFSAALFLLLVSAWVISSSGLRVSNILQFPLFFTGIIIALGTTLPEAAFNTKTILMRHSGMALGNTLGSVVVNTSLFLGLTALVVPIIVPKTLGALLGIFFVAIFVFLVELIQMLHLSFPRFLGIILIILAFIFIVVEYSL